MDVLVKLVVAQEVDIWEVSLTRLVGDFVAEMAVAELHAGAGAPGETGPNVGGVRIDVDAASEFALLAATLIELKSRRLLPEPPAEIDLEEELAAYGLRDAVVARLLEGRTFAAAARVLRKRWDAAMLTWPRTAGPPEQFVAAAPDLLAGVSGHDLAAAMERMLAPASVPRVDVSHLRAVGITVEEAMTHIAETLAVRVTTTFRELTEPFVAEHAGRLAEHLTRQLRGDIGVQQTIRLAGWLSEHERIGACAPAAVDGSADPHSLSGPSVEQAPESDQLTGQLSDQHSGRLADRLSEPVISQLAWRLSQRGVVVVCFLALLELFGSGQVELAQAERFADIGVEWLGDDLAAVADARTEDAA